MALRHSRLWGGLEEVKTPTFEPSAMVDLLRLWRLQRIWRYRWRFTNEGLGSQFARVNSRNVPWSSFQNNDKTHVHHVSDPSRGRGAIESE